MTDELRPCPFCGGEARLSGATVSCGHNDIFYVAQVRCMECVAMVEEADRPSGRDGKSAAVDAAAIDAWNRRVTEYRKPKTLSQLEDESVKLRGLVEDMYAVMVEDAANCDVTYPEQFDDRMQELGIEVND